MISSVIDPHGEDAFREKSLPPDSNGYCYLAAWHFDERMQMHAKHLLLKQGEFVDRFGQWAIVVVAIVAFFATVYFDKPLWTLAMSTLIAMWGIWVATRANRMINRILSQRLCFRCGYSLLHSPVNEKREGCCSECGKTFNVGEYLRPPVGYQRSDAPPPTVSA